MNLVVLAIGLLAQLAAKTRANEALCASATCLATGETPCDRSSASCPPCMYAISGGYSCYDKVNTECPYPDTIVICPPKTEAPSVVTEAPSGGDDSPVLTFPPSSGDSSAPPTATPTVRPLASPSPTPTGSTGSSTSKPGSSNDETASSGDRSASATSDGENTGVDPSADLENSSPAKDEHESPAYVNIAVIAGAALGIVIVCLFIVRRMKRRNYGDEVVKTPEYQNHDRQFTLQVDPATHEQAHRANGTRFGRTGSTPAEDRASEGSDIQSLLSMASVTSSTIEFAHVHGVDVDGRSRAGSAQNASHNGNGTFMGANGGRAKPISIVEGDEMEFSNRESEISNQDQMTSLGANQTRSLPPRSRQARSGSNRSTASGVAYDDEYDIVDPGTMVDAERRNTETLVRDGRFRFLSTVSFTDSEVSVEERNNEIYVKEHEI